MAVGGIILRADIVVVVRRRSARRRKLGVGIVEVEGG